MSDTWPDDPGNEAVRIVVVGGGITGMSAAYYAARAARASGLLAQITLVERDARLGGKIVTERHDGLLIEGGPDSFMAQKPWAAELARELGLGEQIMVAQPRRRTTWVLRRGRPAPLPEGMLLIVPTRIMPFALSPLISLPGKIRMACDLLIPARRDDGDETLADFVRRRLGQEALDRLAEPILSGIHSAECERQSIMATFPRFRDLERRHGSLMRGMLAARRHAPKGPDAAKKTSPFMTLRDGMGALVEALAARLDADVRLGRSVVALRHDPTAAHPYELRLDDGARLAADAVLLTTPTFAAADLVEALAPDLASALRAFRYVSTATITMAFRRSEVGEPLDGYGLVIPRDEGRRVNAITLSSLKFSHRAPDDQLLVRVFAGGSRTPESMALDDAALVSLARAELRSILQIDAEPLVTRVYRWPNGNPQYDVGHLERVAALQAHCPAGLELAGAAYGGVGIPDCVRQGREAAERTVQRLVQLQAAG